MRENYKGFTLVELLAIIVILAIIALITTPVILNVIENSRLNAAKDKAWGTIDAVRIAYATAQTSEQEVGLPYTIKYPKTSASDSTTDSSTGGGSGNGYINSTEVKASGENPTEGTVTISSKGTITASSLKFGNYYCSTINGKGGKLDATKMYCSRTADDVIVPLTPQDLTTKTVTSGDGLYSDNTESGRYVYKGANPNNYITLGSDTYRIISVESDGTLKVIKNGSIGGKKFDLGYSTNISGVTGASSVTETRYSSASTDYCYQIQGTASSNYYGCKVWGSKTTMLDSNGKNVTTMPREVGGTSYNLPSTEAYLNTYLNNDWYNSLSSTVQSKIVTHLFNVGVTKYNETNLSNTITQEKAYKWKGKVGLMTVSDYVKASTNSACTSVSTYYSTSSCYNNSATHNWIFAGPAGKTYSWTISPFSYSTADFEFNVYGGGYLYYLDYANYSRGVAPVLYLSSDITLTGEGTKGSPYQVN